MVVTTEAIYAAYSDHAPDPRALQRYVTSYGRNFRNVLLVGGDSYDPYDYLGLGSISFVPSFYQRINEFVAFGPTDELVVDRDSDRIPDLPIGRLPVRTLADLEAVIAKMWAWQNSLGTRQALVSAGKSDNGTSSELFAINSTYETALGSGWTTVTATVDQAGTKRCAPRCSTPSPRACLSSPTSATAPSASGTSPRSCAGRTWRISATAAGRRWCCSGAAGTATTPRRSSTPCPITCCSQPTVGAVATVGLLEPDLDRRPPGA